MVGRRIHFGAGFETLVGVCWMKENEEELGRGNRHAEGERCEPPPESTSAPTRRNSPSPALYMASVWVHRLKPVLNKDLKTMLFSTSRKNIAHVPSVSYIFI